MGQGIGAQRSSQPAGLWGLPRLTPRIAILLGITALLLGFVAGWLDDLLLGGKYLVLTFVVFFLLYGVASVLALLIWQRFNPVRSGVELLQGASQPELAASVVRALKAQGYRQVRRSADGIEIVCRDREGLIVAQLKRAARGSTVGSGEVQEFMEMLSEHRPTPRAIFITTGSFTQPARVLAQRYGMTLVDGPGLADMLERWDQPPTAVQSAE